jgi:hypothetical protein
MRKFIGPMVVAALAALSLAGTAAASSNLANGTVITGTSPRVDLGTFISCEGRVSGPITNDAAGRGAHGNITAGAFTNCTNGGTVTATTPWVLELNQSSAGGTLWHGRVTGITVDINALGLRCHYEGAINATYSNTTMQATLSGSLTGTGALCPTPSTVSGTFTITPTLTLS